MGYVLRYRVVGLIALRAAFAVALQAPQAQMPSAEDRAYADAVSKETPQAKASALEAYLEKYPQSPAKEAVLRDLVIAYSAIGNAALDGKNAAGAIDAFKKELSVAPLESTMTPGQVLTDTFKLAASYLQATPRDLVACTFYATRFVEYAREPERSQAARLATFCYRKYHGADDGYERVMAAARENLNLPADFVIEYRAPPPINMGGPGRLPADLNKLSIIDKEFILRNGIPEQAAKVWEVLKDRRVEVPDAVVIEASAGVLKVAVSDDAVQAKTADFTFSIKRGRAPASIKRGRAPAVGTKVTVAGTYDSFSRSPLMIFMRDGVMVSPSEAGHSSSGRR